MRFSKAIVRKPGRNIVKAISSANLGLPVYKKAVKQHAKYVEALVHCGLQVQVLDPDEKHPDAVFVEDSALVTGKCAIITRPGVSSRVTETESMSAVLSPCFKNLEQIAHPGTIEGGDILMINDHFYIGLSERTNQEGADQVTFILERYGYSSSVIELKEFLHLKTGVSSIGDNILLVSGELITCKAFEKFRKIIVPETESYAANCLSINGKVIVPSGYPSTVGSIQSLGYDTVELDMSEFRKIDGGLSCLSLRY